MRVLILATLACSICSAQTLDNLVHAYRSSPKPQTRAAVLRFAENHPKDSDGALALLALGATELEQRQFGDAVQHLKAAEKRLPEIEDYYAYLRAAAEFELRDFESAEKHARPVFETKPTSPLVGKTALLQANALLQLQKPRDAIKVVEEHSSDITEPEADDLLGHAYEQAGDVKLAAAKFQHLYVFYPMSKQASDAAEALSKYGRPGVPELLVRATKLIDGGDYSRARSELLGLLGSLQGNDLDLARVHIGASYYLGRQYAAATTYLESFTAQNAESEAERLYYLVQCARRADNTSAMQTALDRLAQVGPGWHWRLLALSSAANYYALRNNGDAAEPLLRACAASFPSDPKGAECAWRLAFRAYLRSTESAEADLKAYLARYPGTENAPAALYFLGRSAQGAGDNAGARACYQQLVSSYPNLYYTMLAKQRLRELASSGAGNSSDIEQFVATIKPPQRRVALDFTANPATRARIGRSELLARAGLDDLADSELRFGARQDGQPDVIALQLAQLATRLDHPHLAVRYIKRYTPDYLYFPLNTQTDKLWHFAFPLPYRSALEDYCRQQSLDPFVVAGLVRQESEFNPRAVSRANAYGLTQVLPSTGRELSRRIGLARFRADALFQPETNLRLGTYYLRSLLDQLQGQWEATLASYNAGKRHVVDWLSWQQYREPAEFVESIPIEETRNYVQSVLRNADIYRQLYASSR